MINSIRSPLCLMILCWLLWGAYYHPPVDTTINVIISPSNILQGDMSLEYYCVSLLVVGHVTLVDITRTTILPGALKVKSLQFLSISGSYVFNPHVHDFQISHKDLTMWLDSRILAFANAGRHAPLSSHLKYNIYGDCNADKREFSWC